MKQRWTALAVASIIALLPATVSAQRGRPQVFINESPVVFSVTPRVEHGVLVAPLGPLASSFGATVTWEGDQGTVTSRSGVEVRLAVGDAVAVVDGTRVMLSVAPARRAGTVWVPAGALLRALGAYVRIRDGADEVEAFSQVTGITWRRGNGGLVLRVAATGLVKTQALVLTAPDRIAVDIFPAVAGIRESKIEVHDSDVLAIRAAQFSVQPYVTRIVLDLAHPVPYTVTADREGVVVTVSQELSTRTTAPPGPPPGRALASGEEQPAVRPQEESVQINWEHPNGAAAPEPLAEPALPEFADGPGAFHIRGVMYQIGEKAGRLVIMTSQPVAPVVRKLTFPDRLAIDLPNGVFIPRREDLEVDSDAIRNIVVAQVQAQPNLTRVLVYLRRQTTFTTVSTDGGRVLTLTLAFGDRPRAARAPAVIIDPGHGGSDSGAVGPTGLREADVALGIGRMVQQALERQGVRVVLTRNDDSTLGLEERPDIARREGGIIFVSIHANASASAAKKGTEVYYWSHESAALAAALQREVVRDLGEPDRGIRTAGFYVLVKSPMPAVLIETAFISNPDEERFLRDPAVQQRIADAIARGIIRFLAARTEALAP
jgi:N-acetylmuramoyl-L-alanine amidase